MLMDCGHGDVIEGFRRLAENGQLEFTGTGKYNPILPLIPASVWR
jgi:alpha-amylase/alpha-mannosidase (GH57 family)